MMGALSPSIMEEMPFSCDELRSYTMPDGSNALHMACVVGNLEMATYLLKSGISTTAKWAAWGTPLHVAMKKKSEMLVDILLEYNCDHLAVDDDGKTSLHIAVNLGSIHMVNSLLQRGSNPVLSDKGTQLSEPQGQIQA